MSINGSSSYYTPVPEMAETLARMAAIDAAFLDMRRVVVAFGS